jgi:hypothetical protein
MRTQGKQDVDREDGSLGAVSSGLARTGLSEQSTVAGSHGSSVLAGYTGSGRFHAAIPALAMRLTRAGLSAHAAQQQALRRLYAMVQSEAAILSYVDMYWVLAMGWVIMFVASFLLKRNEPGKSAKVSVH